MRLSDVAQTWQRSGVSVVPIQPNGTKRPAVRWASFQATAPTLDQVAHWWGNGQQYGLALICGAVSGNLEMLELEGRATDGKSLALITQVMAGTPVADIWDLLTGPKGYSEWSPSGGLHLLYRISDHEVPGNQKVARTEGNLVLAETRGEGGYVVVAPTSGLCHPTGESWELIQGEYGHLPTITWEQRCLIHEVIRLALDSGPAVAIPTDRPPALPVPPMGLSAGGLSPGDDFEANTDWSEIIGPHGWQLESRSGRRRNWTRPGKDTRQGASATTGHSDDRDRLYVFSTSTVFEAEQSYTKFAAYALLNHRGDYHAAAVELARQGFGKKAISAELDTLRWREETATTEEPNYPNSDDGNSLYLMDRIRDQFHYVFEEKQVVFWDGRKWCPDRGYALENEFTMMARERRVQALEAGDEQGVKRWTAAGNSSKVDAAIKCLRYKPGFTVTTEHLNSSRHLVNLRNGILDLDTETLLPHDPRQLMTQMMNASHDPTATCPRFESFMDRVLPDPTMRTYVQRALGYTLLGDSDQRAMFLIYGPSGTGKSTLMEAMAQVFGDYGITAPSGTLRSSGRESAPTNDLHSLRGRRFVSTSETNESTSYNEDLIKRLTGRDRVQSRDLYQTNQEWTPQCVIWLATNHPPKFSTDDDAIWRRAKLVPFTTVLSGEGEIRDFARSFLAGEADGILNWLLDGLRGYLRHGLGEPESVVEAAQEQRLQSDSVSRFIDDRVHDGVLVLQDHMAIRATDLHAMYVEWSRQVGEKPLGNRRFTNRILSGGHAFELDRQDNNHVWRGLGRAVGASILGTMRGWDSDS